MDGWNGMDVGVEGKGEEGLEMEEDKRKEQKAIGKDDGIGEEKNGGIGKWGEEEERGRGDDRG